MGDAAQITQVEPVRVVESFFPSTAGTDIINNPLTIVGETVSPANNAPDPNETLTVSVSLRNEGNVDSGANVTTTLLASGGITNSSAAQNYGTLTAGGAVSRNFTFDVPASTVRGSQITLTFQVQDGATPFQFNQIYTVAAPSIINDAPTIVSETSTPANNAPDPGETVTVSVPLRNVGNAALGANTTVTLLKSGGITPITATQNYGAIAAGATVSRNLTFNVPANAVCGSSVTLTFRVQDGTTSYDFTQTYTLGALALTNSENFDGVTAPALPAGWTSTNSGIGTGWTTSTTAPSNAPNAAFAGNPNSVGLSELQSPTWNVTTAAARLDFKVNYHTEKFFDGAVLEIKIGAGAYQDILAAGGSFVSGGYNLVLDSSTSTSNPLSGRAAWSGNSNGYVSSSVILPAAANGQAVQFRWRMGSDNFQDGVGVRLDDVQLFSELVCSAPSIPNPSFEANNFTVSPGYAGGNGGGITGWTLSHADRIGLNPAGGQNPFANNGAVPHGTKVAFIQSTGAARTLSTTITGLTAGQNYTVSFRANSRAGFGALEYTWSLNGGAFVPFTAAPAVGGSAAYYTNSGTFTATAPTAALALRNSSAGDTAVLLDDFAISVANPDLTVTKTHTGNFTQGDTGRTYSITVSNNGSGATSGAVSVTDSLPAGLTATTVSGAGWNCNVANLTCTRSDALAASGSYPVIILTVNVAADAPPW